MATKKTKKTKKTSKRKRTVLYANVSAATKTWLKTMKAKQPGKLSRSKLVEKIFLGLRTKPKLCQTLGVTK